MEYKPSKLDIAVAEIFAVAACNGNHANKKDIKNYIRDNLVTFAAAQPDWTQNVPTESGLYWWWNGDEDSNPIPIHLGISLPHRQVFAQMDQYGWTRAQNVEEMGGWWMPLATPDQPTREQVRVVKG